MGKSTVPTIPYKMNNLTGRKHRVELIQLCEIAGVLVAPDMLPVRPRVHRVEPPHHLRKRRRHGIDKEPFRWQIGLPRRDSGLTQEVLHEPPGILRNLQVIISDHSASVM